MKKVFLSAVMVCAFVVTSIAQITEGHANYKVDVSSDEPEMAMAISMMQGTTLDIYFKDKSTRTDVSMGAIMKIQTIIDGTSEDVLMLMSGMVGKKAIKTSIEELEKQSKDEEEPQFDVQLIDETKELAGYKCKKAVLTDEEGNEMTFWYTEDIKVNSKGQNYLNDKVPGFPMQYEMNQGGMLMSFTIDSFEKKLKNASELFSQEIPDGYEEMTMEELQSMGM